MDNDKYELSIDALLRFYDEKTDENEYHATAINALMGEEFSFALTISYLNKEGNTVEQLPDKCVTGGKSGPRLDGWLKVTCGADTVFYQTEIKNWSAHSIGGKSVPNTERVEELREHRKNRWTNLFDEQKKTLKEKSARKVLLPMKRPVSVSSAAVKPLIVFWDPMHPTGGEDEWFEVDVNKESATHGSGEKLITSPFQRLTVFSMSNYLRNLKRDSVDSVSVNLPTTARRLRWVRELLIQPTQ